MASINSSTKLLFSLKHFRGSLFIVLMIFVWLVISQTEWADKSPNNLWFAKTGEATYAIFEIINTQMFHVTSSLSLILKATFFVVIFGVLFGVIIGANKALYDTLKLSIDFWRSIPPIIVIPILFRWDPSGVDEYYWRSALVLFGCLPIMTMLIADAINSASKNRLLIFRSFNTSFWFRARNVIFYEILPNIFSGTRTVISFAIVIIIVSEMVLPPEQGIGTQIVHYQTAYEIQFVYAYVIIIGLIGMALNKIVRALESKVVTWN